MLQCTSEIKYRQINSLVYVWKVEDTTSTQSRLAQLLQIMHVLFPALFSYIVRVHMLVFIFRYYNSGSDTHVFVVLHIYVRSVATEKKELIQESHLTIHLHTWPCIKHIEAYLALNNDAF